MTQVTYRQSFTHKMTKRRKYLTFLLMVFCCINKHNSFHLSRIKIVPVIQRPILLEPLPVALPSLIFPSLIPQKSKFSSIPFNSFFKFSPLTPKPWSKPLPIRSSVTSKSVNVKQKIVDMVGKQDQESSSFFNQAVIANQSNEKFAKTEVAVNNVITTIIKDKKPVREPQIGTKNNFSIPDFIIEDSSC